MPKYTDRQIIENEDDSYKDKLDAREVSQVTHYGTIIFNREYFKSSYPTYEHTWKKGDRLFKLAYEYYDDMKYWWIIGMWNDKPTDAHYNYGDIIEIPYPANEIYRDLME